MGIFGRKNKKNENTNAALSADELQAATGILRPVPPKPRYYEELGTIEYVNLTPDGKHGNYETTLQIAQETGKPIFANFVEWSGWQGCKDAGRIFQDPIVKRAAEELFVPVAFNTWDRNDHRRNKPMKVWGAGLATSWWGYLRIIDTEGKQVITGTRQITSAQYLDHVKQVMKEGLQDLGEDIPDWFQ